MDCGIDSDKLPSSISEIQKKLENLKFRCISDPGNADEILSDALEQLQTAFEELSAADEELLQQNDELVVAQEALIRANDRLNMAQRAARAGVWDWNITTNRIEWSQELFDLFGLDPGKSEASFETWNSILHPEDREAANFRIDQALREHTSLNNVYRIIWPDGQIRWINALGEGIYDDQAHPVRMIGICIDITERRQIEEALRDSEKKYRSLFENMLDGFAYCKMLYDDQDCPIDFVYLDVNSSFERLTGVKNVIGKTATDAIPGIKEAHPELFNTYSRVASTGKPEKFEIEFKPLGIWLSISVYSTEKGYFVAVFDNVTDRKQAEEELARLASFPKLNPNPIVEVDLDGHILFLNPAAQELLPDLQEMGQDHSWLVNWESVAKIVCNSQAGTYTRDIPIGDSWYQQTMYLVPDVQRIRIYGLDITERKQVEKALQESEERFRLALRNAPVSVSVQDRDLRFIWAYNQRSARQEDIIGKFDANIFTPEEAAHLVAIKQRVLDENIDIREQMWFDRPIGRMFLDVCFEPIRDEAGRAIGVGMATVDLTPMKIAEEKLSKYKDELELRVKERTEELSQANKKLEAINTSLIDEIKDHAKARAELQTAKDDLGCLNEELQLEIEEHKQTEKQFLKAKEAAEAAAKVKSEFLANMSHELRTPMNSVIGFTSLLLDEKLTPEQTDYIESIRNSGQALMTLINEVLDFSKMDREKMDLELQTFDLRNIMEEALDMVMAQAAENGLELNYAFGKNVPEAIIGDSGKLRQVLSNLLSNSVKFTKEGELEVNVSSDPDQDEIHFAVRDTGIGIREEDIEKLFQPFSQLDLSYSRGFEGTGLGLAISKKLVELMGGRIWVESEVGKGSTFHFIIPAETAPAKHKPFLTGSFEGKRVLIVEDNQTLRRILGRQLHAWSIMPMMASNIQEAMGLLQRDNYFDAVIIDASKDDVVSMIAEKRNLWNQLPFIALTALGQKVPHDLFQAVLSKPLKPAKLFNALKDVLEKREASEVDVPETKKSYGPLRILLAEDNLSNQKVTLEMLKKLGYRADAVVNGQEVLEALERQPYDIIFMDVKMPVMSGTEAARKIRERWPDNGPKIVAVTAYALHGDKEKCLDAGMDGYIPKPVQKEDLAKVLDKYQSH